MNETINNLYFDLDYTLLIKNKENDSYNDTLLLKFLKKYYKDVTINIITYNLYIKKADFEKLTALKIDKFISLDVTNTINFKITENGIFKNIDNNDLLIDDNKHYNKNEYKYNFKSINNNKKLFKMLLDYKNRSIKNA